ncbi:PucR family transcriptional regulator ligand-binding domain-containing protein [Streptomyces sp. TRM75563]|uniref:PucR family transcriptional regulator ligand-binding domain-containing protein n=1 Tax=Streptomyces sp. TRM75563 TaxID=2817418 RepID=UPI001F622D82|nr:PucR family transcriptional regulator ligand-binding domain-containing protein [Streptomyces sp. TRM75563]MCI4044866.1 PucR family transcriptional regulator ligand-binding domain-containing protein [Streptomyces sp. TRM75563]
MPTPTSPPPPASPSASPSPPGPPTPPIPLAELLSREELGLRRIAGPADADLLWVHTSEMADPYPYLLGGELLLSAGVLLTDPDHYVGRLVEAGAAALGFGVRPVHETVPAALIEACDRYGLPLLEVPPETPFTTIARAVWRLMAEARHRELRRVTRAQQALATAAARPDPVPAVLHQLAAQLGGRAALLTARGEELHAAGRAPAEETPTAGRRPSEGTSAAGRAPAEETPTAGRHPAPRTAAALTRLARVVARERPGAPTSATDTHGDTHLAAYALGGAEGLVLALATRRREPGDHTVAGIAVVLLSLLAAPHQDADAAGRSAALVRMLLGASPAEVAPLLGATGPWTVIHARRTNGAPADALTAGALGASLGTALVDAGRGDGEPVRVLLPSAPGTNPVPPPAKPDTHARTATATATAPEPARVTPQPGWTLGASAPTPVTALDAADHLAARALAHAQATRAPLTTDAPASGLAALVPPEQAAAHARALLAPLTAPLADTLRCWLSLHGNWDRTAVALAVHRNTVRQRIGRCGELLGMDLDDMDVRTELWFALRQG